MKSHVAPPTSLECIPPIEVGVRRLRRTLEKALRTCRRFRSTKKRHTWGVFKRKRFSAQCSDEDRRWVNICNAQRKRARAREPFACFFTPQFRAEMEECPMRGERDRTNERERERERAAGRQAGRQQTCSNSYSERSDRERERLAGNAVRRIFLISSSSQKIQNSGLSERKRVREREREREEGSEEGRY